MKKEYLIPIIGLGIFLIIIIGIHQTEKIAYTRLFNDWIEINKIKAEDKDQAGDDFIKKCLATRAVYQFSWFKQFPTKLGKLNLEKRYCMSLKDFNNLIELSIKLNKHIGIQNIQNVRFYIFSKWIFESAINSRAEHKTGEILKMTGYTTEGFAIALYHYKYDLRIDAGSPLYIPELYDKNCDPAQLFANSPEKEIKFDYAYIWFLLQKYKGDWEKVLTAFHWGENIVDTWENAGINRIPDYRFAGSKIWLRSYYETVFDIAVGIESGNMSRIEGYDGAVREFKKHSKWQLNYIEALKIKFKQAENIARIEQKLNEVCIEFNDYKKISADLIWKQNQLNEVNFDIRSKNAKDIKLEGIRGKLIQEIIAIQKQIKKRFK